MAAKKDIPEKGTYRNVCINEIWDPTMEQHCGFYEGVIRSKNINYKNKDVCMIFLKTQAQAYALINRGHGWTEITDEWFEFLEEKEKIKEKQATIEEKPVVKRKRGRPRKKVK